MSSSKKPDHSATANHVYYTSIPGIYADASYIASGMKVVVIQGQKTEFTGSSFKPEDPSKTRSTADLVGGRIPGMWFNKKEVLETTCVMWTSEAKGREIFVMNSMSKDGEYLHEERTKEPGDEHSTHGKTVGEAKNLEVDLVADAMDETTDPSGSADAGEGNGEHTLVLKVFLHHSRPGNLTLNTRTGQLTLSSETKETKKKKSSKSTHTVSFNDDSTILYSRFKKGQTLRFVNCGFTTKSNEKGKRRAVVNEKVCHVQLPPDPWYAEFEHKDYAKDKAGQDEGSSFGPCDPEKAEHNVRVFWQFMTGLTNIVGKENVKKYEEQELVDVE